MSKIVITLDTETGRVDYQGAEKLTVSGGANSFMRGDNELVVTGWQLFITLGKTPEDEAREQFQKLLAGETRYLELLMENADYEEAAALAAKIDFGKSLLERIGVHAPSLAPSELPGGLDLETALTIPPDGLMGLSVRAQNSLFQMSKGPWAPCCTGMPQMKTVKDMLEYTRAQLLAYPGLGRGTLNNIEKALAEYGLKLKD